MKKIYSALVVPYKKDGSIDESGLREIIRYNINHNKVDGLYVGGSSGENFLIDTQEKKRIFEITFEEVKHEIDLIAQVGSININEAKELARYVYELGYKKLSAVTPYYYQFNFEEIKGYYDSIIDSLDVEMIIYSIPALTGVTLSLAEFDKLFENPKITGIKFTSPDFFLLERIRNKFTDKKIYYGFDEMLLPALALGVDGAIGSTYNLNGRRAKDIIRAVENGNLDKALSIQKETNNLIDELIDNGLYNSIKLVINELGVDAMYCRKPFKEPSIEQKQRAKEIANKYFNKL